MIKHDQEHNKLGVRLYDIFGNIKGGGMNIHVSY